MAKRGRGKAGFANLQDVSGQIQIYSQINDVEKWLFKRILETYWVLWTLFITHGALTIAIRLDPFNQIIAAHTGKIPWAQGCRT